MYFCVTAKCGHVRRNFFILKDFAVWADNGREAAEKVRNYPRVKHDHKDAIRDVVKITKEQFDELKALNNADPYLTCKSIQEQNARCSEIYNDVIREEEGDSRRTNKKAISHKSYLKSKNNKNVNYYDYVDEDDYDDYYLD